MSRFITHATLLTLLAAAALPALAGIDVEVRNGDQVLGTLSPATETEIVRFRAPAGAFITVKAAAAKKAPKSLQLRVVLKDHAGGELRQALGRSAKLAGVPADPIGGMHSVEVTSADGSTPGDYSLSITWRSPTKFGGTPVDVLAAGTHGVPFAVDAGATASFSVKASKRSTATPDLMQLTRPDSSTETFAGGLRTKKETLGLPGNFLLTVRGGAAGGSVVATVTVKAPKASKRKFALTASVIGSGDPAGDTAFAAVIGSDGGSFSAPLRPPGTPGAELAGSAIGIPTGALPIGTAIVIATAPDIGTTGSAVGAGPTVFFGPEGVRFDAADKTKRATVTIPFDPAFSGDTSTLVIYTRDAKGKVTPILQPPNYVFDAVAGTVSFQTSHFSSFRVVSPIAPTGGVFITVATLPSPQDVCDAFDQETTTAPKLYYVAEGDSPKAVGALRLDGTASFLQLEAFAGGGTVTIDGTDRASFQFVDDVRTVTADDNGKLYVGTKLQIFAIATDGKVTRFAGTGSFGDTGDNGSALQASFKSIRNLLVTQDDKLFVIDDGAHRIRVINLSNQVIGPWAGSGTAGFGVDGGSPSTTTFLGPSDMALAPTGGMYVADGGRIRLINPGAMPNPVNTTVAGDASGATGGSGDGGPLDSARFTSIAGIVPYISLQSPTDVVVLVTDSDDHVIRRVNFTTGIVTLVAGVHGSAGFSGDSGPLPGVMNSPTAIVAVPGLLTVVDKGNGRVRSIFGQQ